MNKLIASGIVAVTLFGGAIASAQSYYPTYSGSCVNLSSDLSYGQKGSNVTQLQSFLVSQNYPGGGNWMVTGYFGTATVAAVRNFQQTQGLPMSGSVDASTRAAISRVSCGGGFSIATPVTSYNYTQPYLPTGQAGNYNNYYNSYPYNYNYGYNNYGSYTGYQYGTCGTFPLYTQCPTSGYGTSPHLTSFSTTVAAPGSPVTVYGTGFDPLANTVYVGGTTLSNIVSTGGTSLTFTVPANATGSVSVTVANSRGTSNALTLTVNGYGYPYQPTTPCGAYGYQYGYGYNCPPNTGTPAISYLSPNSGAVGTSVTIFGSGFSSTGNTVHFGNGIISNLQSYDGYSVSFTIPTTLSGYGYQPIGLGTYDVSVANSSGVVSNKLPFTITSTGSTGAVTISSVTGPTSLGVGVSGTWSVVIQNPGNASVTTSVTWGDNTNYANQNVAQTTYAQGTATLTFSHVYYANGTYTVTFTVSNGSGQSNTSSATVYVSGTGANGVVSVTSMTPTTGPVGTQITITGTGFDAYNNTVHFGNGGTMHVPAYNGVIYYTVPSYLSPCDVSGGGVCAQYLQQVTPGSYPVYVTTPSGSSGATNFQVL